MNTRITTLKPKSAPHIKARLLPDATHWEVHPLLDVCEDYILNRLPSACKARLAQHAQRCKRCQTHVVSATLVMGVLKRALAGLASHSPGKDVRACPDPLVDGGPIEDALVPTEPDLIRPAEVFFTSSDLADARRRLSVRHSVISRCLSVLNRPNSRVRDVETLVCQDPVLAAHLVKVANSSLPFSRDHVRSVAEAIVYIGFERTRLHVLAVAIRAQFPSPQLKQVWNHSISVAATARRLAELSHAVPPDEAFLAGLVHDIGRVVLCALGPRYSVAFDHLRQRGVSPVDIEWKLCGSSHAHIGGDLLEECNFPTDIAEAVRQHHAPFVSDLPLSSLLYLAESWNDTNEDVYYPLEHSFALGCLGISTNDLRFNAGSRYPDLDVLRFAA